MLHIILRTLFHLSSFSSLPIWIPFTTAIANFLGDLHYITWNCPTYKGEKYWFYKEVRDNPSCRILPSHTHYIADCKNEHTVVAARARPMCQTLEFLAKKKAGTSLAPLSHQWFHQLGLQWLPYKIAWTLFCCQLGQEAGSSNLQ